MSLIKSIKQVLGLGPAAENHFWDGSVPNQLSLKRGTPEAPGVELIKALNGVLSFPNQEQSLAVNGYVKLPGGLIVQWGTNLFGFGIQTEIPLSVPFPSLFAAVSYIVQGSSAPGAVDVRFQRVGAAGFFAVGGSVNQNITWIAIGY